jgi:hypothetical protein
MNGVALSLGLLLSSPYDAQPVVPVLIGERI